MLAKKSPVLSVACNPETNTIVAGTELVSSQAVVAFWYVSSIPHFYFLGPVLSSIIASGYVRQKQLCQTH